MNIIIISQGLAKKTHLTPSYLLLRKCIKDGTLIGGENVEKGSDKMKKIEKSTKTDYIISERLQ